MPAGGGRGKGGGLSFSTESLGFGRGEVLPSAVLSPPPTFPPLNNKPVQLETENEFLLTKSTELRNYFRSSQYYLGAEDDSLPDLDLDWSQFPEELRPNFGKKKKTKSSVKINIAKKKSTTIDIERTLSNLEQRESKSDGEEKPEVDEDSEEEEGKPSEAGSEADEPDDEMDGGTDYANNYFDNGEDYVDDEDDNLDEGGIY